MPWRVSHDSTDRISTFWMPDSSIWSARSRFMTSPASAISLPAPSMMSSAAVRPTMRSARPSIVFSPSLSAEISTPRRVAQSGSVTTMSWATSTRRRVR